MADVWDDPGARAWAHDVETRVVPAMRASEAVVPVFTGTIDAKLAVELGAAVLLGKPLILVVRPGTQLPDKLVQVADRILEGDVSTERGRDSLARRMKQVLDEIVPQGDADA